jgi:Tfp pilus assembly protein FimV
MVTVAGRGWRTLLEPIAFLLAATVVVVVAAGVLHRGHATSPPPARHGRVAPRPAPPKPAPRHVYVVRAGDTLTAIATRTGVPLDRLRTLNPQLQPTALFIGEKIRLR